MKFLINILFNLLIMTSFGQIVNTYSYGKSDSIKIEYSYYFDTILKKEVFHGTYYKFQNSCNKKIIIKANYKHGLLNGNYYEYTKFVKDPFFRDEEVTGYSKVTKSYIDGIPNGKWRFIERKKIKKKSFDSKRYKIGRIKNDFLVTFHNGIMVNELIYKVNNKNIIYGHLDETGKWINKWKVRNSEYTLDDGFVIEYVEKNRDYEIISNGKLDQQTLELVKQMKDLSLEQLEEFCCQHNLILSVCQGTMFYPDYFQLENSSFIKTIEDFRKTGYLILIEKFEN